MIRENSQTGKNDPNLPVGISRLELKPDAFTTRIAYQALVKHLGKFKPVRFYVSNKRNEDATLDIATSCRTAYEQCEQLGYNFDYNLWKKYNV